VKELTALIACVANASSASSKEVGTAQNAACCRCQLVFLFALLVLQPRTGDWLQPAFGFLIYAASAAETNQII
jgi:hypothetical protein